MEWGDEDRAGGPVCPACRLGRPRLPASPGASPGAHPVCEVGAGRAGRRAEGLAQRGCRSHPSPPQMLEPSVTTFKQLRCGHSETPGATFLLSSAPCIPGPGAPARSGAEGVSG